MGQPVLPQRPQLLGGRSSCQGHGPLRVRRKLASKVPRPQRPTKSSAGPRPVVAPQPHTAAFSITLSATWTSSAWTVTAAAWPHACWWSFQSLRWQKVEQ